MKAFVFFICLQLTLVFLLTASLSVDIDAEAAILMNAETGAILFEKNIHSLRYPSSTTKVATALYALHLKRDALDTTHIVASQEPLIYISADEKVESKYTLPAHWLDLKASHISIEKDEEFILHDLLKGMLIASGSDAANLIAYTLGDGSIPKFMEGLNDYIKQLGCQHTTFYNPHGLHHPQHQTTAYDLALIAREALKDPIFCNIVTQKAFVRPETNKQKERTFLSTNKLFQPGYFYYDKAIGVKTGTGAIARMNFIGAARHNGRTLIVVLLKSSTHHVMFSDTIDLFEAAFNETEINHVFLKKGPQKFSQQLLHADHLLETYLKEDLNLNYYPAEDPKAHYILYWEKLSLPIKKDQKVGELYLVSQESNVLTRKALLAQNDVGFKWPYNWIERIKLSTHPFILGSSVLGTILAMLGVFFWKRRSV
jgi:D-alanyl-D-alanine carboxypeptidase (penicillin-binding protein 5/6)